jgi:RNA polymerase sigma-70 factor (ECF subfamily)
MERWQFPCDPLVALQRGDSAPFEDFVRRHARTLVTFFRQRGAGLSRAEELTQEVFLKLFQGAPRYQPEERFAAFCFRVARNAWIDECRRQGVRAEELQGPEEEQGREFAAPPEDPSAGLQAGEQEASIQALLATLPEGHRAVFELAVLGELGYAEISAVLGIPEGTVKSRMFYAVRRLRLAWSERHDEEGVA